MKILIRQMTQATGISPVIGSFFMFISCTWLELRFTPKINILVGTHPSKDLSLVTELQLSRECLSQLYDTSSGLE